MHFNSWSRDTLVFAMYMRVFITLLLVGVSFARPSYVKPTYIKPEPNFWRGGECGSYVRQSPINIESDKVVYGLNFNLEYNDVSSDVQGTLVNNGHAPSFSVDNASRILSTTSVPGLGSATFKLASFHLHFGPDNSVGSEHKIDGKSFPSEMHFVHINTKYKTSDEAFKEKDGLAVIGVFLQQSDTANPELIKLTDKMNVSSDKGYKGPLSVNPNLLMPTLSKLMTYPGSLTTPPCSEVVQWFVADDTMPITSSQLEILRALRKGYGESSGLISTYGNDRPLQPVNGRQVDANFEKA